MQGIVVLTMVVITFAKVDDHVDVHESRYKTIPCYLALFAFAIIFEILTTLDALKRRNVIQLMGICTFQVLIIVLAALQIHQTHTALVIPGLSCEQSYANCGGSGSLYRHVLPYLIVSPCILFVALLLLLNFTRLLYIEFGWVVFYIVGANRHAKTMYQFYQVLNVLLLFDFFAFIASTMQLLILVLSRTGAEFPLTIIAIPVVLILIIGCIIAAKYEVKWLMTLSLVLMCGAMAYFLYKLTRLFMDGGVAYVSTRATLAVSLIVSFLLTFATFAIGLRCFADFDKDLKQAKTNENRVDTKRQSMGYITPGTEPMLADRPASSYAGGTELAPRISIE
ncbi:hypothetical protein FRB94_009984 [Tulasnella sp. JGI-2019a]|nr:hypothetical protein FRB93_011073 [Tulasnella sp. JGI-2019a]KAG9010708.1 hypothetical protein FRB94_009984 [Tulasnella sp. JGI-2019a]